jgi:hypothetical protein
MKNGIHLFSGAKKLTNEFLVSCHFAITLLMNLAFTAHCKSRVARLFLAERTKMNTKSPPQNIPDGQYTKRS